MDGKGKVAGGVLLKQGRGWEMLPDKTEREEGESSMKLL